MSLDLVIFDCDGTLVDSQHLIHAAMVEAFARGGLDVPAREAVLSIVGLSLTEAVSRITPEAVASDARAIAALVDGYRNAFTVLRTDPAMTEPLYDGIRETLDHLAARPGTILGIATGKSRKGVDRLLEREGFEKHFSVIRTADDAPSKPHPAMILTALEECGAHSHRAVMIGDTTFDIEMAGNAGIAGLGVGWGYHPPDALMAAGAARVLNHAGELPAAIDTLLAAHGAEAL